MDPKLLRSQLRSSVEPDGPEVPGFNRTRLTFARRRRGYKKAELAQMSKLHIRSVTAFEAGEFSPCAETLERIADVLKFPSAFFCGDDIEEPNPDTGSFRSMSKMSPRLRDMALCQAAIGLLLSDWLAAKFELPTPGLPDLSREPAPEAAAEALRRSWLLGVLPIRNMVHLLEAKGVHVFSLSVDAREVDAFSMWKSGTPYVFLNTNKTSEHSRFDAAHELGHLVLHKEASPNGREAEMQANRFAAAFLMPSASVYAKAPRFPVYDTLVKLKRVWAVSVAALAYRLHELQAISDWQYRGLAVEIAKRGRNMEPASVPREASLILPMMFRELYKEGITRNKIAQSLAIYPPELDQLLLGLTINPIEGGRRQADSGSRGPRAELRRVK
jgi:Zn-dependent peptidase ImmA (M78 family)/DNA-binding XRE family transcriptional regulator